METINTLRTRLAGTVPSPHPQAEAYRHIPETLKSFAMPDPRLAAVLVPVMRREPVPTVLFTRRADNLPDHPGQVSFPGGSSEPGDADPVATALRETREELGVPAARIETLGFLAPYATVTQFVIVPVVGVVEPGPLQPDPREVAAAFEVPIDYLLRESTFQWRDDTFRKQPVGYWVVRWHDEVIWGATAHMLHRFCALLK